MISYVIETTMVDRVRSGEITQLIRVPPVRCTNSGARIRLIDARAAQVIPDPVCRHVAQCQIHWAEGRIALLRQDGIPLRHIDRLARACGHDSVAALERALWKHHQNLPPPRAFVIEWVSPEAMMGEMA